METWLKNLHYFPRKHHQPSKTNTEPSESIFPFSPDHFSENKQAKRKKENQEHIKRTQWVLLIPPSFVNVI
jgi:hypothetical protein